MHITSSQTDEPENPLEVSTDVQTSTNDDVGPPESSSHELEALFGTLVAIICGESRTRYGLKNKCNLFWKIFTVIRDTIFGAVLIIFVSSYGYNQLFVHTENKAMWMQLILIYACGFSHLFVITCREDIVEIPKLLGKLLIKCEPDEVDVKHIKIFWISMAILLTVLTVIELVLCCVIVFYQPMIGAKFFSAVGYSLNVDINLLWPKLYASIVNVGWFSIVSLITDIYIVYFATVSLCVDYIFSCFAKKVARANMSDSQNLLALHNEITDAILHIDSCLNFPNALIYAYIVIQTFKELFDLLFSTAYGYYRWYFYSECAIGTVIALLMIIPAAKIPEQKKNVLREVCLLTDETINSYQKRALISKIQRPLPSFTFWNMIEITRGTFITTIGALTTYIVILGSFGGAH